MKLLISILSLMVLTVSTASAEAYFRAHYGNSSFDTNTGTVTGATFDDEDNGYYLSLGTQINDKLNAEVFYFDGGNATFSGTTGNTFVYNTTTYTYTSNGEIELNADSVGLAVVYPMEIQDRLSVNLKVGVHSWDTKMTLSSTTAVADLTDDGVDPMYGISLDYEVGTNVSFSIGYDHFTYDNEDVGLAFAGFKIGFGGDRD